MSPFWWESDAPPRMIRPPGRTETKSLKARGLWHLGWQRSQSSVEASLFNSLGRAKRLVSVTAGSWRDKNERDPWNRSRKSSAVIDILRPRSAGRLALRALKLLWHTRHRSRSTLSAGRLALRALKLVVIPLNIASITPVGRPPRLTSIETSSPRP